MQKILEKIYWFKKCELKTTFLDVEISLLVLQSGGSGCTNFTTITIHLQKLNLETVFISHNTASNLSLVIEEMCWSTISARVFEVFWSKLGKF